MNPFQEMLSKSSSSLHHTKMLECVSPLYDRFGINHFWYYKISLSGYYSYLGTHQEWNEFCCSKLMSKHFPCLRHPECLQEGINLMKATTDKEYQKVLDIAWKKFKINFNINLINVVPEGIEAFGFATRFNDSSAEELLLNNLSVLREFTQIFKEDNQALLLQIQENQVHLPSQFNQKYYERPKTLIIPFEEDKLLNIAGFKEILSLTSRERDILKFIASGHPVLYIAARLNLSLKTVENYIASLKYKLSCTSSIELIQKAQKIETTSLFDL